MVATNKLSEWTDEKLIDEAESLHQCLFDTECYSASDVLNYENVIGELERRGYVVREIRTIVIEKEDEFEDEGGRGR